jgi:hypothetical protein
VAHLAGLGVGGRLQWLLAARQHHLLALAAVVVGLWLAPGLAGWLTQLPGQAAVWVGLCVDHGWLAVLGLGGVHSLLLKMWK